MPIKVSCHCGQSFTAKDDLKGQTLLCPKCHQPLTIGEDAPRPAGGGGGGGMDDLFDDIGLKEVKGQRCPKCGHGLQDNAVICVNCGFNSQTGEKVKGVTGRPASGGKRVAESMLSRAEQLIAIDKEDEKKNRSQGAPAWTYFVGLALVIGFATTMYVLPRDDAFRYTGWAIVILGVIVQAIIGIRLIIVAFMEDVVCGLLYLFLPFYNLYYIISRWSTCGSLFVMALGMGAIQGVGFLFIYVSPWLKPDEKKSIVYQPAPSIVCTATLDVVSSSNTAPV